MQNRNNKIKNKHTNFKVYAMFITVATVLAVILLNTIAGIFLNSNPVKFDLTKEQVYTLSEHSENIVKSLSEPLSVYAVLSEETDAEYFQVRELLDKYDSLSDNLTVTYYDPYEDYDFMKKYTEKNLNVSDGSIILEYGSKLRQLHISDVYSEEYGIFFDFERKMTASITRITNNENEKIYVVNNHGELSTNFPLLLDDNLIDWAYLNLNECVSSFSIPKDASIIVINAPRQDYSTQELALIDLYLSDGGKAIFSFRYDCGEMPNLYSYLEREWGLKVQHEIITENSNAYMIQTPNGETMNTAKMLNHSITSELNASALVYVAPNAMPVSTTSSNTHFATVTPLVQTSSASYTSVKSIGPYTISALSEVTANGSGKVLYMGSFQTIDDVSINTASNLANGDFILNAIDYMTDNTDSMGIRSKNVALENMTMTQTHVSLIYYILKLILPGLIIAIGVIIRLKRRYR